MTSGARSAADLRRQVAAQLVPVRPLAAPWRRTAGLLPVAALLLVAAPVLFGLRQDLPRLGWLAGWGFSVMECVGGLLLVAAALREAVPGRARPTRALACLAAAALGGVLAVTFATFALSPTRVARPEAVLYVWRVCFAYGLAGALPAIALSGSLAARALPLRPGLTGALYGLGSGLLADAGWRLFCHFSDPAHVVSAHVAAMLGSALLGAALATALARRR